MKKIFSIFLALTLSAGLWAETQMVSYDYPVYINDDATKGIKEWKTNSVEATVVENATDAVTWNAGWYVVTGTDVTLSKGAVCNGAVHLIVYDGAKLTATGADNKPGIEVSGEGNSLTIYGYTNQSGQLIAKGGQGGAGIGGGNEMDGSNITINGGTITATGSHAAGIGGGVLGSGSSITTNGVTVTATGSHASGIAGESGVSGSYITINGGTVTATGSYGAGIGGGSGGYGSNITISGGTVTATSNNGAGIGGGDEGSGSDITINGGTVEATGDFCAAGIGGGYNGESSNITISGGTVTANGGEYAAGIGGGYKGSGSNIIINGGNVITESANAAAIGGGYNGESSNIFVASSVLLMAGSSSSNRIEVPHFTGYDMATILKDKRYVMLEEGKATAYVEGYNAGKAEGIEEGKAEVLGEMGEPCTNCPSIEVTKGDKTVKLYNPEKVEFKKE